MTDWSNVSLHHYTTFQALESILTNRELWLGNLKYMNDRLEMEYFFKLIKQSIEKEEPKHIETIESIFSEQLSRFESITAYACSFSKLEEDAAQWDRYANKGRGVCISFNADAIQKAFEGKAVLQPVYYSDDMSNHQLKEVIKTYIKEGVVHEFSTIEEAFSNGKMCSVAFKHPSFRAEEEVRLIRYPFTVKIFNSKLKYKASESGLREYYPLKYMVDIDRCFGRIINKITLGPSSGVDKNLFERYLQTIGVDLSGITIAHSKCPLR